MTSEPYASARREFWVVNNGSSHNGARSLQRMREAWPRAELVHLPVHASWLNQVEIFFAIVQRKVVKPQDFTNLAERRPPASADAQGWTFGDIAAELCGLRPWAHRRQNVG